MRLAFLGDWRVGTGAAVAAVICGAPMLGSTIRRYHRSDAALSGDSYPPDGRLPGLTAASVIVIGAAALVVVITA